jgi:hypothetical protein
MAAPVRSRTLPRIDSRWESEPHWELVASEREILCPEVYIIRPMVDDALIGRVLANQAKREAEINKIRINNLSKGWKTRKGNARERSLP